MNRIIATLSCSLLFVASAFAQDMSAEKILQKVEDMLDISHSRVETEMRVYREQELRTTYRMDLKYQDTVSQLAETLYPPRNKGDKTLHVGDNTWLYLAKINKTLRVSEGNSFSNSDFSNMDLMKTNLSEDYTPALLGVEDYQGEQAYKLELKAKTEDVPYARILYWIRKRDLYPVKRDYYTFSGDLLKSMVFHTKTGVRNGAPDTLVMTSMLEKDKYTEVRYVKIERGQAFPPETFNKDSFAKR
ncbi:MAG: outer membrane lipoprotein-sorting protein [Acidobacteria bacterium]|nr:outer membrane lipoprotein-sorting protein [Acidobacteriota bacterium]